MHAAFIPYGKIELVEQFLRDVAAQKFTMKMWKDEEVKNVWIEGQLRKLPFGIYEVVFPKEHRDMILTTLNFNRDDNYISKQMPLIPIIKKHPFDLLRKALNLKKVDFEFNTDKKFLWSKGLSGHDVAIIPIGIREDRDTKDTEGEHAGWNHEAI